MKDLVTARPPLFLAGPTAVGKSAVALQVARELEGEIISVDSMQVYQGMDVGTSKPSLAERQAVRHHLVDILSLSDSFDAAQFVTLAKAAQKDVEDRGKLAIFCGGTGLYFRAFLRGLGRVPAADPVLRNELKKLPLSELLAELRRADPATYSAIDRANLRRVIRAIEVIRRTGRPFSEQREPWADWKAWSRSGDSAGARAFLGLERGRDDLYERIDERVDRMFKEGLVQETEWLLKQGLAENRTAQQALGYRQVLTHLRGEASLEDTVRLVKQQTRKYAKRQMTWFRREPDLEWVIIAPGESAETVGRRVTARYKALEISGEPLALSPQVPPLRRHY